MVICKIMKYKLNYYTIYHYLIFFFTHGVVFKKTIERANIFKKNSERKILEKIYIQAREIFDEIIESEKYYDLYFGKNNYEIVVEVLLWSIEHILELEIKDDENIFKLIFGINISSNKKKELYKVIEELYSTIKKRNILSKSTKLIELANEKNIKTNPTINKQKISSYIISSRPQSTGSYYSNNVPPSSNITSSTTVTNSIPIKKSTIPSSNSNNNNANNNNNNFFQYVNNLIQKEEINNNNEYNINSNYSYRGPNSEQNTNILNGTSIIYGPNNRIYLSSNKKDNTNSIFNVNSIEKVNHTNEKNGNNSCNTNDINKRKKLNREIKTNPFKRDKEIIKEPSDNKKFKNEKANNKTNSNQYVEKTKEKTLIINNKISNDDSKVKKKSSSVSKNMIENIENTIKLQPRPSARVNINKVNKLEKSTRTSVPLSSKALNNFYFNQPALNENEQQKKILINPKKKEIIVKTNKTSNMSDYKKYKIIKKNAPLNNKNNNGNNIQSETKNEPKIIKDTIINRTKYLKKPNFNKLNNTYELEPLDNYKRRSVNKYYYESNNKNNINKKYNTSKTIIINNNIHINTLIDNNNYLNQGNLIKNGFNRNEKLFLFENKGKNILEQTIGTKYKNVINKRHSETELNNNRNKINNSNIIF